MGSKDKIKYLSDSSIAEKAKKIYSSNKKVEIVQLSGARHGFMNPAS
jgi:dienelactone hydrolase